MLKVKLCFKRIHQNLASDEFFIVRGKEMDEYACINRHSPDKDTCHDC
jgi:hypothetical protein